MDRRLLKKYVRASNASQLATSFITKYFDGVMTRLGMRYSPILMTMFFGGVLFSTNVQAQQVLTDELPVHSVYEVPLNAVSPQSLKDFVTVIDLIRRKYYYPIDDEVIFEDAMIGILKGIDPYAEFLDKKGYENLQAFSTGELAQVGIRVKYDSLQNVWVIEDVEKGSPAANKGIKPQSLLHQIDQQLLSSKYSDYDVAQMLKGLAGTQIQLVVSNHGRQKRSITLQRNVIEKNKVSVTFDDGLVIIQLPVFQTDTKKNILDQLSRISQPITGVLIDIRNNPGGVLDAAVDIVGLMQEIGDVVLIQDRVGNQELIEVISDGGQLTNVPVVVLQNRYSASASEVLASSLKINDIATIVGEDSYGKGSIQEVLPINDTQAIKLTVAHYLQADGSIIDGVGVKADIYFTNLNKEASTDEWLNNAITIARNLMPRPVVQTEDDADTTEGAAKKLPVLKQVFSKGQQLYQGIWSGIKE